MKTIGRRSFLSLAGLGLALAAAGGCQTQFGGMTLPSPRYLQHPPQYFPPSPAFPLTRELAAQEAVAASTTPGVAPLPPPVVPPPVPPPQAVPPVPPVPPVPAPAPMP
jgi:hypothetical protein